MSKPATIKDLLIGDHVSRLSVKKLAQTIFDGKSVVTTVEGLEGYVVTLPRFDDLSDPTKQYIVKALLDARVANVLDAQDQTDAEPTDDN